MKMKIKQLFCKHDSNPCTKKEPYLNLSGTQIYYVCKKCGKTTGSEFLTHEEQLLRFGKYI